VIASAGCKGQAVAKLLLKVGEALVADKVFLRGEGTEVGALTLVTDEVGVISRRELHKAGEVVLAVELEKRLKGWQSVEVEGGGLNELDLGALSLEDYLVLLVAGAKSKRG